MSRELDQLNTPPFDGPRGSLADFDDILVQAEEREATVLFADLRGFTTLAEDRSPVEVLHLVNRCVPPMILAVRQEYGMVDKFLGDGIMAVFGLSVAQQDHAERAVRAARAIQANMAELEPELRAQGWDEVGIGIGLETGRIVAGQVDVPGRREFTVLGDVVNVASRLTAGASAGEVVLGEGARTALARSYRLVSLGSIPIRGRRQPVRAWRLP